MFPGCHKKLSLTGSLKATEIYSPVGSGGQKSTVRGSGSVDSFWTLREKLPCLPQACGRISPVSASIFSGSSCLCVSACPFLSLRRTPPFDLGPTLIQDDLSIFAITISIKTLFPSKVTFLRSWVDSDLGEEDTIQLTALRQVSGGAEK